MYCYGPASSNAARIAPMRPSHHVRKARPCRHRQRHATALGAPALRRFSSFSTYAVSSMIPSWPCVVYGSSAMSVITTSSGSSAFMARTDLCTRPSGLLHSIPSGVFLCNINDWKQRDRWNAEVTNFGELDEQFYRCSCG